MLEWVHALYSCLSVSGWPETGFDCVCAIAVFIRFVLLFLFRGAASFFLSFYFIFSKVYCTQLTCVGHVPITVRVSKFCLKYVWPDILARMAGAADIHLVPNAPWWHAITRTICCSAVYSTMLLNFVHHKF